MHINCMHCHESLNYLQILHVNSFGVKTNHVLVSCFTANSMKVLIDMRDADVCIVCLDREML